MDVQLSNESKNIFKTDVYLAKKGDKLAFQALINENRLSLYRVAKGILKNEEDTADAIQETIIKAFKGIRHLKKEEYFKTWIIKILINECNSILRITSKVIPMSDVRGKNERYEDSYLNTDVFDAVVSLVEEFRIVILLYYYEDFSVKTISRIINVAEGTVKSRLSRARLKLHELLKEGSIINEK